MMNFTLIVCTYMRPEALCKLLLSVDRQTLYPSEILIVDGSLNDETDVMLQNYSFKNLYYFLVDKANRGLTKQRNFGITKASNNSEIICFLDDDTILEPNYFEEILKTYSIHPDALGVGGYINNEVTWKKVSSDYHPKNNDFFYDSWIRNESSRFIIRKMLQLDADRNPGCHPSFSHGRSISFLPPSGKIYEVEQLMGGVSSFRKSVFKTFQFSTYFEGYGLYEDADFTLRVSKSGRLYINTNAQLGHFHDSAGRPNKYNYGKMVVRNGWYVWRVKYPKPGIKDKFKWHSITLLLTFIRFSNIFTTNKKQEAFTEFLGRTIGWFSLFINKPRLK